MCMMSMLRSLQRFVRDRSADTVSDFEAGGVTVVKPLAHVM